MELYPINITTSTTTLSMEQILNFLSDNQGIIEMIKKSCFTPEDSSQKSCKSLDPNDVKSELKSKIESDKQINNFNEQLKSTLTDSIKKIEYLCEPDIEKNMFESELGLSNSMIKTIIFSLKRMDQNPDKLFTYKIMIELSFAIMQIAKQELENLRDRKLNDVMKDSNTVLLIHEKINLSSTEESIFSKFPEYNKLTTLLTTETEHHKNKENKIKEDFKSVSESLNMISDKVNDFSILLNSPEVIEIAQRITEGRTSENVLRDKLENVKRSVYELACEVVKNSIKKNTTDSNLPVNAEINVKVDRQKDGFLEPSSSQSLGFDKRMVHEFYWRRGFNFFM